jgi:hypothetical protein
MASNIIEGGVKPDGLLPFTASIGVITNIQANAVELSREQILDADEEGIAWKEVRTLPNNLTLTVRATSKPEADVDLTANLATLGHALAAGAYKTVSASGNGTEGQAVTYTVAVEYFPADA